MTTIVIAQAAGSELKAEVLTEARCSLCGGQPADLGKYYRELGERAAEVLYDGTPGSFWQAIEDYAVERALRSGTVQRPLKAEDITRQWLGAD